MPDILYQGLVNAGAAVAFVAILYAWRGIRQSIYGRSSRRVHSSLQYWDRCAGPIPECIYRKIENGLKDMQCTKQFMKNEKDDIKLYAQMIIGLIENELNVKGLDRYKYYYRSGKLTKTGMELNNLRNRIEAALSGMSDKNEKDFIVMKSRALLLAAEGWPIPGVMIYVILMWVLFIICIPIGIFINLFAGLLTFFMGILCYNVTKQKVCCYVRELAERDPTIKEIFLRNRVIVEIDNFPYH